MRPRYIELRIAARVDSGDLLAELDDPTVAGAWEDEGAIHIVWAENAWRPERGEAVRAALARLGAGGADVAVAPAEDRDWQALWAESLEPLTVGSRLVVRQSWHPPSGRPEAIELVIDPRRAFGTGHHASTRLLLEALEAHVRGGERVLDAGTGSGILAMAALRLGAAAALGIDTDRVALGCARGYARRNGFGPELRFAAVALADLRPGAYDLVLANLDRPTLLALPPALARQTNPGGRLLLSGLLVEDGEEVRRALAAAGFAATGSRAREDWLALELEMPA